jgi:L-cysteine:1D-myo-inositol 2-amino-2-deoxy-alpha-D-glucopyranoside ligase
MRSWPEAYIPKLSAEFSLPPLSVFNTATKRVEKLPAKRIYRMYVCGITPYDATHLGHAATYLTFDLIHRYLKATGSEVRYVQNITDIDDPLLERAARDGVDWEDLAKTQIDLFRGDMTDLHILPPQHYVGVVEAMDLVISSISALQESETTYNVGNDLYFRVHSDKEFGTRSDYTDSQMLSIFAERGGDPDRKGKEHPLDALVWLAQRDGEPGWASAFGMGRPGWHIECCAIALHYLHPEHAEDFSIDIQGGGSDLIFPHHEMSAAQSRIIGKQGFARTYIHSGMVGLDGEKMSKSRGNLVFVSKLIGEGADPMAIRWALMGHRFSDDLMWGPELLNRAVNEIDELRLQLSRVDVAPTTTVIQSIINALSNNLDTQEVQSILRVWMSATKAGETGGEAGELSRALDTLLGLAL